MNTVDFISPEVVRLAFVIGMVASVLVYEKSHLTTGSIVIPGFFGIHVFEPLTIATCLGNAIICYLLVHRLGPRFCMMSNKSKFHGLIVISVVIQLSWQLLTQLQSTVAFAGNLMAGLGFVVPGLLAHDMARNGSMKTIANSTSISVFVGAIVFGLVAFFPDHCLRQPPQAIVANFDLVLLLTLSTLGSVILKLKTNLRSGGYVTPAYVAFFIASPELLALILGIAMATHFLANQLLIKKLIIFGRRKFATMLLVGSLLFWCCLSTCRELGIQIPFGEHPMYAGILILLPGLIANEIQRTSLAKVSGGMVLVFCFTYGATALIYELYSFARPQATIFWIVILLGSGTSLQLLSLWRDGKSSPGKHQVEQRASI